MIVDTVVEPRCDNAPPSADHQNRQLNAALHRIALTQAHRHEPAKQMMKCRKAGSDSGMEALRVLKRRLSDVVFAALRTDLIFGRRNHGCLTEELEIVPHRRLDNSNEIPVAGASVGGVAV